MPTTTVPRTRRLAAAPLLLAAALAAAGDEAFETPPTLRSRDLLGPAEARGPRHAVRDEVPTDGWTTRFTLDTDFGVLEAAGREVLAVRVAELAALARLDEVSRTSVFAEAAKRSATKPYHAVRAVVDDPRGTVQGLPAGVGRLAKRTFRKVKKGVLAVKDAKEDHDQAKREEKEGLSPSPAPVRLRSTETAREQQSRLEAAGGVARDVFGWSKARREWARQLRVDPYTTNPVLAKKLDDVAWAAFAGGFAIGTVMPALPAPVGTTQTVSELVWDLPPADLEARNEKVLKAMGVEGRAARDFFRNGELTPTQQTTLVDALAGLRGVVGRAEAVALAAEVPSAEEARFLVGAALQLARLHAGERPLAELEAADGLLLARDREDRRVLAVPDDHLSWTGEVASAFALAEGPGSALFLAGTLSPRARDELRRRGFEVHEGWGRP